MKFQSENDLIKQVKTHHYINLISDFSLVCLIAGMPLIVVLFIKKEIVYAVTYLIAFVVLLALEILIHNYLKKEEKGKYSPYAIKLSRNYTFEDVKQILAKHTTQDQCRDFPEDNVFFCFMKKKYHARVILNKPFDFDKTDFDSTRRRINKMVNKEYGIKRKTTMDAAYRSLRVNILAPEKMNNSLYKFMSKNAGETIGRIEGIINFAIVDNQLIIPPIYGEGKDIYKFNKSYKTMKGLLTEDSEETIS